MIGTERITRAEVLKQRDGQTCLFCCLLMNYGLLAGKPVDSGCWEKELHHQAFGLYPEYTPLSQLAVFIRKFEGVEAEMSIDSPTFTDYIQRLNREERIKIVHHEIDSQWITTQLQEIRQPVLVFVDYFYLGYPAHTPHWILVLSCQDEGFEIVDSGIGETRIIDKKVLKDCIGGLKYVMLWSPAAITLSLRKAG